MIVSEERNRYPEVKFSADFEISKNAPFKTVDEFVNAMGTPYNSRHDGYEGHREFVPYLR